MKIETLLENITNENILLYITISISILFFFTTIIKIELGHLLALLVTIIILTFITISKNDNIQDDNKQLDFKLNSLLDDEDPPNFFYIDADLINLFYNIKQDFAEYNIDSYKNGLNTANTLLNIRFDIERDLCNSPLVPDIKKNFTPTIHMSLSEKKLHNDKYTSDFLNQDNYNFKDDKKCKSILINAYENYQLAEHNLKECMNNIHSFIITIPSDPVIHRKHEKVMKRLHILLKRNLDVIKDIYKTQKITHSTKMITDYDLPKAINKQIGNNSSFNFY